jgi:hypothetical protein
VDLQGLVHAPREAAVNMLAVVNGTVQAIQEAQDFLNAAIRAASEHAVPEVAHTANEMLLLSKAPLALDLLDTDEPAEFCELQHWVQTIRRYPIPAALGWELSSACD